MLKLAPLGGLDVSLGPVLDTGLTLPREEVESSDGLRSIIADRSDGVGANGDHSGLEGLRISKCARSARAAFHNSYRGGHASGLSAQMSMACLC